MISADSVKAPGSCDLMCVCVGFLSDPVCVVPLLYSCRGPWSVKGLGFRYSFAFGSGSMASQKPNGSALFRYF